MSEYTLDDFKHADFAINPPAINPGRVVLIRSLPAPGLPWEDGFDRYTDQEVLDMGCIPYRVEDVTRNPYSPEALQQAWENGERVIPGETATEGLVTILRDTYEHCFSVYVNKDGSGLVKGERIIYRRPDKPQVSQLKELLDKGWPDGINGSDNTLIARQLEALGVQVKGEQG